MNITEQVELIRELSNTELLDEIRYQMFDVDEQRGVDGYNEIDALDDIVSVAESNGDSPKLLQHCREIEIALGRYRLLQEADLVNIVVTGGKKYDLKLKGLKYLWIGD